MVAQFDSETFAPTLHTPGPISTDPDDVRLALETARAFQGMGEFDEAVEWLERAAERAAEAGQRERAIVLLQAMAKWNRSAPRPCLAAAPPPPQSDVRNRDSVRPPPAKLPPCPPPVVAGASSLAPPARTSTLLPPPPRKSIPPARKLSLPPVPILSLPPPSAPSSAPSKRAAVAASSAPGVAPVSTRTNQPNDASSAKGPPRASVPPKRSSHVSNTASSARAASSAKKLRAAISGLVLKTGSFTIELLARGQPLPAGTIEATLTLSDDERTIEVVMGG
jgi:hypothetical protein